MSMLTPLFDALNSRWFESKDRTVYHMIWAVLLFPLLMVGWAVYAGLNNVASAGEPAAAEVSHLAVIGILFILTALVCWMLISFLQYVNQKQMKRLSDLFATQSNTHLDLSKMVEHHGDGETGTIVEGYNQFRLAIRDMVEDMRRFGVKIAVDATKVNRNVSHTSEKTSQQKELLDLMTTTSAEASQAISEVSQSAQYVSDRTTKSLQQASESFSELQDATQKIEQISTAVAAFRDVVDELNRNSTSIMEIIAIINNISEQTNLLSLNATIEAARAGEHGRGFAVVAEEVRNLARRVKPATEQITENINTMAKTVKRTMVETDMINTHSSEASRVIASTGSHFESMIEDFEDSNSQLVKIAGAIEELSINNSEIQTRVVEINDLSQAIFHEMDASAESVGDLHELTENMQQVVSGYRTGTGKLDPILTNAHRFRDGTLEKMIQMHEQGIGIFDRQYREVANTNPQKFMTAYAEQFDRAMQADFDQFLETEPAAIFALATDINGYVPTHHSKNAQPMTGDFEVDLLHSRDKRLYASSESEVRRAKNTDPILMQTYMRDTGEILCEVSMPLVIDGRHWGAFIMGYTPPIS